ncbi:uncharacterized protein LOC126809530 [Patella vulgata]|uniref:uncharacterized protein LOC126809530 n=1 Tax=Patella vulgata TaxID=6465 RepID=UPI00217FD351|nr:uncharacterized protein LOC126809530 [Patella vulgata]
MDVKESLSNFLISSNISNREQGVVDHLSMIFSQFNKRTLTAVVKYQCSFTPQVQNLTQICIDFILDNDALLYEVDAQAVCISNSDDLDDDCQIMNWPVPGDDQTPSPICSASASTKFASVKPPPPLDKSLLESTRVSLTPTADCNAALSSAEKTYSVLENCTVDKHDNSSNNTKTSSGITEIDKQFSPSKTQNVVTVYESSLDELPKLNMKFRKGVNRNSDSSQNDSSVTSTFITDDTSISGTCNTYKATQPCTSASLTPVMSSPDKIKETQCSHVKQLTPTQCNQGPIPSSKQSTSFTDFINKVVKDAKAIPDKMMNVQHRNSSLGGILGHNETLTSSTKTSVSSIVTDTHEQNNICIKNRLNDYITNNRKQPVEGSLYSVPNSQSLPDVITVERLNTNCSKNSALKPVITSIKNTLLAPSISQNNLLKLSINGVVPASSVLKPSTCSSTITSNVLKANITNINSMIKDNTDNDIGYAIKPATAGSGVTVPNIINAESLITPPIITVRSTHTLTSTVTTPKSNSSVISNTLTTPSNSSTIRSTASPITEVTHSTINMSANNKQVKEVLQLFADVDPDYVDRLLLSHAGPAAVNNVCAALLDNPDYPKKQVIIITDSPTTHTPFKPESSTIDYYKDYPKEINYNYMEEVNKQLQNDFPFVSVRDINNIMKFYNNYYAPSYRSIFNAVQAAYADSLKNGKRIEELNICMVDNAGVQRSIKSRLLKCKRAAKSVRMTKQLQMEMDFIANMNKKEKLNADAQLAMKLNEDQYEEAGESIECLCCYGEHPFENMVQCFDGHLFCKTCLQSYVKEAVFGSGKLDLSCMTDRCDSSFPESQLELCLAQDVLEKYQDRVREENLNLADIEDLVRCPGCDFAAILDPGDKVFRCQNIHCLKETCRFCKEEWKDHMGIPCSELEKKDEMTLRKEYEEKMTAAKVRTCVRCKSQFMKDEGCNKMTCRCGASMCYICRKPNISYSHFCQHPRDPGHNCSKCTACSLWSNPEEDDKRAVLEIQHEAQLKRKEKGFLEDKVVGAPDEPPSKRARTS